jgi:hypothetical protein
LQLACVHAFNSVPEPLVEPRVVAEAQPLAQETYFFLGVEKVSALPLYENLAENPSEEVDVPPQGLVLRFETEPLAGGQRTPPPVPS